MSSDRNLRWPMSLLGSLLLLALLAHVPACDVPPATVPDNSADGGNAVPGALEAEMLPGAFMTIRDPAILAGQPVTVEFTGPAGFRATMEAYKTRAGEAAVPIPPLVDVATGEMVAGTLSYGVLGSTLRSTVNVAAPPPAEDTPPGAVLRIVLEAAAEEHERTYAAITQILTELGANAPNAELPGDIFAEGIALRARLATYDQTGQFVLPLRDGTWHTMTAEEMTLADRWLASLMDGLAEQMELEAGLPTAKLIARAQGQSPPRPRIDTMAQQGVQRVRQAIQTGAAGASTLAAGVGIGVCLIGLAVNTPVVVVIGGFCAVAGAAASFVNGAAGGTNADAFLARDPRRFDASAEALSQTARYGLVAASAAAGPVGQLANVASLAASSKDFYANVRAIRCTSSAPPGNKKSLTYQSDEFCVGVTGGQPPISPPECPAPSGSLFVRTTTENGQYSEYWLWPPNEQDGKPVGLCRTWYGADKTVLATQGCRDSDGRLQGLYQAWSPSGALRSEVHYTDGQLDGLVFEYYPGGGVLRMADYKPFGPFSAPDGVEYYYDENGRIVQETTYADGVRNGRYRRYHAGSSVVFLEGWYVDDRSDGHWCTYNADGSLMQECVYQLGQLVSCAP